MGDNSLGSNSNGKELAIKIPQDLISLLPTPLVWREFCCIYKVPRPLRELKPEAYTPQVVSIGPIHHGDKKLKGLHKLKLRYLAKFCQRANKDCLEIKKEIQDKEEQIRRSYLDTFDELGKDEFIEIVLLDSAFVIELLWKKYNNVSDIYMLDMPWLDLSIRRDLMLLENQLPFFILEHLYNLSYGSCPHPPFCDLVSFYFRNYTNPPTNGIGLKSRNKCDWLSCFYCFWVSKCFSKEKAGKDNVQCGNGDSTGLQDDEYNHFIDVIRKSLCKNWPKHEQSDPISNVYNVKALHQAGVKFQMDSKAWPLGVKFENGVLQMPSLCFQDTTESLFRNVIAYEQCHYPHQAYFSNYIMLLDYLIDTEDDVQLLVQSGVVTNLLGHNKAVNDLVNNLGKEIVETQNCYHELYSKLIKHCENSWYQKVATMRSVYFGNIWKGTGTIAAFILLVFSFIQTLNSMIHIFSRGYKLGYSLFSD